jgi:gliding motility-associated-like protein
MKKICFTILCLFILLQIANAGHIAGGEMFYKYLGPGSAAGTKNFQITLRLFRDCNPINNSNGSIPPLLPSSVILGIFTNGTNLPFLASISVTRTSENSITLLKPYECIQNPPTVCYQVSTYETTVELPDNENGYTASFQTCCRINGLSNTGGGSNGSTYLCTIPGTAQIGNGTNSSPEFDVKDTVLICRNKGFTLPFTATDPDGDSLSYSFCDAYASPGINGAGNNPPASPPYSNLNYQSPYDGSSPMGNNVVINPKTGIISGRAPSGNINPGGASYFIVNVCISEWRNGVEISQHRKDFTVKISDCDFADAELPLDNRTCDGFSYTFQNLVTSNQIRTYFWDFGVTSLTNDTSNLASPPYTYADTGVYNLMLIVNRGEVCTDTAFSKIYVYPGFFPAFNSYDGCKNIPIQFTDASTGLYGTPNYWYWDFGNPNASNDTSRIKNPQYSYPQNGTYRATLLVGSSRGCLDTVSRLMTITDKPPIQLTNDTLICSIDTLQLAAFAQGTFAWTPNYNINNLTVSNPLVSPDIKTKYYVTVTLAPGCVNTDSVIVDVRDFVSFAPLKDTTICRTDEVTFQPNSDGLYYAWSPANLFTNANIKNATARPTQPSTLFTVVSSIGKCNTSQTVTVRTVPYPVVDAGNPVSVCFRDTTLLTGSGNASSWLWSPARFVGSPQSLTTTVFPLGTSQFVLRGTDTLGCPKPVFDTVLVTMIPKVNAFAGNDTAVVVNEPLQLNATGATFYQWSIETSNLSNSNIANPIALFTNPAEKITYYLRATTPEGCFGLDTINIRVFKTVPTIFVPTAFTPDGNRLNDMFIPIAVGITKLDYFRVFNRWGNEVFATTTLQKGWDGTYKGIQQAPDTYVWMVSGTDFTGKKVVLKGTVNLIR